MRKDKTKELEEKIKSVFEIYDREKTEKGIKFYGTPKRSLQEVYSIKPKVRKQGFKMEFTTEYGENILKIKTKEKSSNKLNLFLAFLTLLTTLFAGSIWYSADPLSNPVSIIKGWPFTVSIMSVLGAHEFGHYIMSKYHGVEATLPYFIPFPSIIGTMGAVIKIKGAIPNRKALFDIGIAGPFLGLIATIIVTTIGLYLPEISHPPTQSGDMYIKLNFPPLYTIISQTVGTSPKNPNPVVIGGWVGMLITFLNLLPVGQLDGGHILKSISKKWFHIISYLVPVSLFILGIYVHFILEKIGSIWFLWGIITLLISALGSAKTIEEIKKTKKEKLGKKRVTLAIIVFILGILSFTPVPVAFGNI